jgi:DegV family protein with EDD domain
MTVKIVTDSTCDIPTQLAEELGITVVPIYVMFGDKSYRDRVDMSEDEFYNKLVSAPVVPSTSVPSPNDFAEVYSKLAQETDEIVSIHLTSKESGTYNSAILGKELLEKDCRIDVIDSQLISMSFGLVVLAAAQEARAGAGLEQVGELVRRSLPRMHILFLVDTLKYVVKGGRLSKSHGLLGTVLRVRPMLTMRDGELKLSSVARTKAKAVERLYDFARGFSKVKEIAIPYTTAHDEAQSLADRIKGALPDVPIHLTRVGASLGTHAGPGAMGVAVWEG